jgi:hypothetical protein
MCLLSPFAFLHVRKRGILCKLIATDCAHPQVNAVRYSADHDIPANQLFLFLSDTSEGQAIVHTDAEIRSRPDIKPAGWDSRAALRQLTWRPANKAPVYSVVASVTEPERLLQGCKSIDVASFSGPSTSVRPSLLARHASCRRPRPLSSTCPVGMTLAPLTC